MIKEIPVFNIEGEKIGIESVQLQDIKPNLDIIHRYVVAYLANQRQGTASTKTRAEVSGSGRKPWRQKGTGRARVDSIRTPIWRHGGIVFGPKPRDYNQRLPEKMKKLALRDSLFSAIEGDGFVILEIPDNIEKPKTKIFANFIGKAGLADKKVLFILNRNFAERDKVIRSIRNIENVSYCYAEQINPYLILTHDRIVAQKEIFPYLKDISSGESDVRSL